MPRIWILAIISAVNSSVMDVSTMNVTYCKTGIFSNVFGVLSDTEVSESRAHIRMSPRTHSYRNRNHDSFYFWKKVAIKSLPRKSSAKRFLSKSVEIIKVLLVVWRETFARKQYAVHAFMWVCSVINRTLLEFLACIYVSARESYTEIQLFLITSYKSYCSRICKLHVEKKNQPSSFIHLFLLFGFLYKIKLFDSPCSPIRCPHFRWGFLLVHNRPKWYHPSSSASYPAFSSKFLFPSLEIFALHFVMWYFKFLYEKNNFHKSTTNVRFQQESDGDILGAGCFIVKINKFFLLLV